MNADFRLELVTRQHAAPLEQFELANRAFFAARVGDRGDAFFEDFSDRLAALVEENQRGSSLLFVVVDKKGEILGRVNLSDIDQPDLTELGFRVAEHAQGLGVASASVSAALEVAATRSVRTVMARASIANSGSRRVLERCGFEQTGPAETPDGSSASFVSYRRDLSAHSWARKQTTFRPETSDTSP